MKKILWVLPRWPFPETDGARVATAQVLKAVGSSEKFELYVFAVLDERDSIDPEDLCRQYGVRAYIVERRRDRVLGSRFLGYVWRGISRRKQGITFSAYAKKNLREKFKAWVSELNFDAIVFDGLHAAALLMDKNGKFLGDTLDQPLAYRAHNVESALWTSSASQSHNPARRALLRQQGDLVKNFERSVVEACDVTLPVSPEDEFIFQKKFGARSTRLARIGMEFKKNQAMKFPLTGMSFGFIGRLDWLPNREGLDFILREVWPELRRQRPEAVLYISGQGPYPKLPEGVIALGFIEDLSQFYEKIQALLVPIFSGSGTRVKAIEASSYARTCIGTRLGMAGLGLEPGKEYLRAETAEEWIEALSRVQGKDLEAMGQNAWKAAGIRFGEDATKLSLLESMVKLSRAKDGVPAPDSPK